MPSGYRPDVEKGRSGPFPFPSTQVSLARALGGFALAATAIHALAVHTLATRTGFVFDSGSIHNVLQEYGGMPWSKG
jgi:hypothetical protein